MASSSPKTGTLDIDPMTQALDGLAPIDTPKSEPADDTKPKRTRTRKAPVADKTPRTPGRKPNLEPQLQNMIASIGMIVRVVSKTPADGDAIIEGAAAQAIALQHLADQNDTVRRVLTGMLETSAWGEVMTAFAPTVFAIMANHGANPLELLKPKPAAPVSEPGAAAA